MNSELWRDECRHAGAFIQTPSFGSAQRLRDCGFIFVWLSPRAIFIDIYKQKSLIIFVWLTPCALRSSMAGALIPPFLHFLPTPDPELSRPEALLVAYANEGVRALASGTRPELVLKVAVAVHEAGTCGFPRPPMFHTKDTAR